MSSSSKRAPTFLSLLYHPLRILLFSSYSCCFLFPPQRSPKSFWHAVSTIQVTLSPLSSTSLLKWPPWWHPHHTLPPLISTQMTWLYVALFMSPQLNDMFHESSVYFVWDGVLSPRLRVLCICNLKYLILNLQSWTNSV